MENIWKKYRTRPGAVWIGLVIDVIILILYAYTLYLIGKSSEGAHIGLDILSNVLLVGFSVLSTSLISVPFIEVKGKNELFQKHILTDVLSTPESYAILAAEEKADMLSGLESNIFFDCNIIKQEMYSSIRDKIIGFSAKAIDANTLPGCFFESCKYDIECTIEGSFIVKSIMKVVDLCSYQEQDVQDFVLCSSSSENAQDGKHSTLEALSVNGVDKNVQDKTIVSAANAQETGTFNKRSGYKQNVKYVYNNMLHLSPTEPTQIATTHKTAVPDNDLAFTCRLSYPCHHFEFRFKLLGEAANKYRISVNAFGFAEDGKKTPNRPDDSEIKVSFNNWIFPMDGIAVTLIQKS